MGYLNEFHRRIEAKDFMGLLQLWEEYCTCDEVDAVELNKVLQLIRDSDYCDGFGNYAESILPLWKSIQNAQLADSIFEKILDIQTTNSPVLAELAYDFLKDRFGKDKHFNEKIRLVGLRNKNQFRSAIRNYKLLSHMEEGCFVFHNAGWGTGEVLSISLIREELTIEFENVAGKKQVSFENAFKTLKPLDKDHFLAMRFGNPDALEVMAKQDPVKVVRKLLTDLGPKSAAEIKDEMSELVIPKADWTSWWQQARTRLKKDSAIQTPTSLSEPFALREKELSPAERFIQDIEKPKKADELITMLYNFVRDFSEYLRQNEVMATLENKLKTLESQSLNEGQLFEICCLGLETPQKATYDRKLKQIVDKSDEPHALLLQIPIIALQKKFLICLREQKPHWPALFAELLTEVDQTLLREYLFKELLIEARAVLDKQLEKALQKPQDYPEFIYWYLQKAMSDISLPYGDRTGLWQLIEAYLIALHAIESQTAMTALVKKMFNFLTAKRYAVIRELMEGGDIDFLQEFLLLASKCQSFSHQDNKILASLAMVACPQLKSILGSDDGIQERVIWSTEEGMQKVQSRIEQLSTVEMLDNAKEIETARSHGDLRENSEYKFALERRSRIQGEIRALSRQLSHAKILSKNDLDLSKISVGTRVALSTQEGQKLVYTILGPWEADTENNIISFQSKLAASLLGKTVGEKVHIQGIDCSVLNIESALE
jgi:transcription elongation factor GreA